MQALYFTYCGEATCKISPNFAHQEICQIFWCFQAVRHISKANWAKTN